MQGKVVIINPFFTQCTGVCPVMNTNLQKIQNHLGDKLGTEVNIISLTVDHENDTQKVLFEYAQKYGAKEGWHFLTGEKANIEFALGKLGKLVNNREAHDAVFLVGNLETKLWKKVNGLANINDIIALVDSVVYDSVSK
jgi:cytochrome oxidase Cu insertion factor (SCO1/SenC/PrrC family)